MQFIVPQYIDIEDKLFGPLSFRQFVYAAGGAGISFLAYRFLPFYISIFIIIPVLGLSLLLAFYRINNRPFLTMIEYAARHWLSPKLYVWKSKERLKEKKEETQEPGTLVIAPSVSESKLKDLAWSLDVRQIEKRSAEEVRQEVRPYEGSNIPTPPPQGIITPPPNPGGQ